MRARDRERFRALRATWRWAAVAFVVVVAPMVYTAITDFSCVLRPRRVRLGLQQRVDVARTATRCTSSRPSACSSSPGIRTRATTCPALPLLGPVLVVPFLLGIWHCWRRRDDHGYALVLLGLPVFLIPPLVANEGGAPHFLRSLGLEPYVAACIGLGCLEGIAIARRLASGIPRSERSVTQTGWMVCAIAATALGVASAVTYLNRPVADRYAAFTFADVALANAAVDNSTDGGPSTLVILDSYDAMDVQFLDAGRLPTIVAPMTRIANAAVYSLIVAPSRADIAAAVGSGIAAEARVGATDPQGNPVVFDVVPQAACRRCREPCAPRVPRRRRSMVGSMLRGYCGEDLADHGRRARRSPCAARLSAALARRGIHRAGGAATARLDDRRGPQRQRAAALLPGRAALRGGVDQPGHAPSLPGAGRERRRSHCWRRSDGASRATPAASGRR